MVTAHADGLVAVHVLEDGELLHRIPVEGDATNVELVDDDRHLAVTTAWGSVEVLTLDTSELLAIARQRVVRGFASHECAQYRLDPCPTRQDLRAGD